MSSLIRNWQKIIRNDTGHFKLWLHMNLQCKEDQIGLSNVYTEPALLRTAPELHSKGTITESGARLDIVAQQDSMEEMPELLLML